MRNYHIQQSRLALEFEVKGIRSSLLHVLMITRLVNCVYPGTTLTAFHFKKALAWDTRLLSVQYFQNAQISTLKCQMYSD